MSAQDSPKNEGEKQEGKSEECPAGSACRVLIAPEPGSPGNKEGIDAKGVTKGLDGIVSKGVQDVQRTLRLPKF